ncbi:hypothetical protein KC909_06145, partial [Candidatus Dojkabacteria bacterium]|nr:hypothetical protein [Candidatus Dojkabacteria bacterium]
VILQVNSLTVDAGGKITADGQGYQPGDDESGSGIPANAAGTTGGSGGGYGGAGGEGVQDGSNPPPTPGTVYGNQSNPVLLGSPGGASGEGGSGGAGGGAIKIEAAGIVTINGQVTADGKDGIATVNTSGGGGAGGSVWIDAGEIAGNGIVRANGGSAAEVGNQGGGGGGGRVIVVCDTVNNFVGTASANGGSTNNSQNGGNGTVLGPSCRPDEPTILRQYEQYTVIPSPTVTNELGVGDATRRSNIVFAANVSDYDTGELHSIEIEIKEVGVSFTGTPNYFSLLSFSSSEPCQNQDYSGCAYFVVTNLVRSKEYHWRVRIRDDAGFYSDWVSYGGNSDPNDVDLLMTGDPDHISIISGNNQIGTVAQQLNDPLVAEVQDANGFGVPDIDIQWLPNQGSVENQTLTTNNDGQINANRILGQTSGAQTTEVRYTPSIKTTFDHTAEPDDAIEFIVDAPFFADAGVPFNTQIDAVDQFGNIDTNFASAGNVTVNLSAVDANDEQTAKAGVFSPTSFIFSISDMGSITLTNTQYDTEPDSLKIKADDGNISGISEAINMGNFEECFTFQNVSGAYPNDTVYLTNNITWTFAADQSNLGVLNCSELTVVVEAGTTVTLSSYDDGDNGRNGNELDDFGVKWYAKNLEIEATAIVSANGQGYRSISGTGNGPGGGDINEGASYGGYGQGNDRIPYGDVKQPTHLGSAGFYHASYELSAGGSGGGAIDLNVTNTLTIDGTISANGARGTRSNYISSYRAGSGGSLWIKAATINGAGLVSADGYDTDYDGGGGRIAVYQTTPGTFAVTDKAHIHAFGNSGGPGTIYLDADGNLGGNGDLWVNNNGNNKRQAGIPYDPV